MNDLISAFSYESKGKQWAKSQPAYPVGMNPAVIASQTTQKAKKNDTPLIPGLPPAAQQAAKKKKKKSAKPETEVKEVTGKLAGFTIEEPNFGAPSTTTKAASKQTAVENSSTAPAGNSTDPAKRLKNVKKKLKDIEALEAKIKSGELKNPDKDQLEKIKRKSEVVKEIKGLEKLIK